jgi:hypothetical protein
MRWLDRVRIWAAPVLLLVIAILATLLAARGGLISRAGLVANKGWLDVAGKLTSSAAILVTAILAYFRFFRGRTFARRASLAVDVTVLTRPDGNSLHTIVLHVSNIGTAPIWDPRVQVRITESCHSGTNRSRTVEATYDLAQEEPADRALISVLDSGEMTDFAAQATIGQDTWAVTYLATLRSSAKDTWSVVHAVAGHEAIAQPPQQSPKRGRLHRN